MILSPLPGRWLDYSKLLAALNGFSVSQIRQLEADLKRKSDLLSEVKVLLKSAADRERRQLAESDELKRKLRLVRPETPLPGYEWGT